MTVGLTALILTALLDIYTTHRGVKLPNVTEANPLVRWLFGPRPKVFPMLLGKAVAVGAIVWLNPGEIGYFIVAAIWATVSLHNLKIIRRVEDANG